MMVKKISDYKKFMTDMSMHIDNARNSSAVYMGGTEVLTSIYTGQKMFVDTRDLSETPHLVIDGIWEREVSAVFEKLIEPGDTVFDIGSTYGYYGLLAGTKLRKDSGAKLYLIDANPTYVPYMTKNMTVNGLIEFSIISNIAIAGKAGKLELNVLKDDWASSTFQTKKDFAKYRTAPYEFEKTVQVEAMTIDQYASANDIKSADMIKLDIEGLEEESYPGMAKLIKSSPNLKMLFEFTTEGYKKPTQLFEKIRKDFEFIYCMPEGGQPVMVQTYDEMINVAKGKWIMLLISKIDISNKL